MKTKFSRIILTGKTLRKYLSLILTIAVSFGMVSGTPATALAEDNGSAAQQGAVYVALGDSVPAGYGLSDTNDCYVKLFSDQMMDCGYTNTMFNYAVSGATTNDLLSGLQNMQSSNPKALLTLQNADVITLNIGGNNVLGPLIKAVNDQMEQQYKTLGITSITEATQSQLLTIGVSLISMNLDDAQMTEIKQGAQSFAKDFPKIITWLKTNAPDANIIVSTIYNPIPNTLSFYQTSEPLLKEMNAVITKGAKQSGYYVADVYSAFNTEQAKGTQIINLNLWQYKNSPISVDIHPNTTGHELIAKVHHELFQTIPTLVKTNSGLPVTARLALSGKVKNGTLSADITEQLLQTAIDKAKNDAKRFDRERDGIAVMFQSSDTGIKNIKVKIDKAAIKLLNSNGIKTITLQTDLFRLTLDNEAIKKIDQTAKGTITVKTESVNKLSKAAKKLIGSRPVFKVTLSDTANKIISNLGKGTLTFGIRYAAPSIEKAGSLYIVSVNSKDQPKLLTGSGYVDGWVTYSGNILSTYGVGYKE